MGHCNFYFWGCLSKVTRLLLFMIIFKANTVAYKMKRLRPWFRYHAPITFKNAKKVTRLYLHASVSGYTCMQAYPGDNTKRGKWVYSCSTQVGGLYGTNENLIRCEKGVKFPKKGVKLPI